MGVTNQDLEKYAEVAVHVGVNLQPGQELVVTAPLHAVELVRIIARKAYEAGAKNVHVEWNDEKLSHLKYKLAPEEAFSEYPEWRAKGWEQFAERGASFLSILSQNPDLLQDVDPQRVATANKTASTALQAWRSYAMSDRVTWSLIAVPSPEWAAKIFPELPQDEAVDALWDQILKASRIDREHPVEAWHEHNAQLGKAVDYLNGKRYQKLVYTSSNGTDLTVGLPDGHNWLGGGTRSTKGIRFNPNIPTEEVFTMPHKDSVDGIVYSTKPLIYGGNVIDNFWLRFENGSVVEFSAEKGYDTLKLLLDTDEGARRLGEVALVPFRSPISDTNLIFYTTLYDENASSHFALGRAYPTTLEGGTDLSQDELLARGANNSLTHVDFMIGAADTDIDGITAQGDREPLFRGGNWAISFE